ncbi:MAG: type II secretion system F family protein [Candidatus Micrarchaeota archaeon]|nr:type II secretion system F family protein [Candidatus Micrarchaeota archaeon]
MTKSMLPLSYKRKINALLEEAGMKIRAESFFNRALIISLASSVMAGLFSGDYGLVVGFGVFVSVFALMHGIIYIAIEKRVNFVEEILPDTLELMSANMRAGFIPSRALILSAREEFGPLADAIKSAGKDIMTGGTLEDAFKKIGSFVKSDILRSTMKLINEGTKSGGQLVSLLEETAIDIRRKQAIKKEVKANILMYGIFIVFAGCVAAPILYALTIHLVGMISQFGSAAQVTTQMSSSGMGMFSGAGGGGSTVSQDFLYIFSIIAVIITTFFSGLIVGIIDSGKEKSGIKYIPLFMALALIVFFIANGVLAEFFSSMMV